jgi:hypothetical protein
MIADQYSVTGTEEASLFSAESTHQALENK